MGEAHTLKGDFGLGFDSVAGLLDTHFNLTKGRVYTTVSDNGPGSRASYHGSVETVTERFPLIATALGGKLSDTFAVSTNEPSLTCQANPVAGFSLAGSGYSSTTCGDGYDTILFVRLLTPDDGKVPRSALPEGVPGALARLASVRASEARRGR